MTREVSSAPLADQFRQRMEVKENAEAAIRDAIPAFFLTNFRFDTLELAPVPFSAEERENLSAGVVYKCQIGRGNKMVFALMLDAGIESNRIAHFDVLNFRAIVMEHLGPDETTLTNIIPILFWPGEEKQDYQPWDTIFSGGKLGPDLKTFMPNGDYIPANFSGVEE